MLSPRDSESAYSLTTLVYSTNVNFSRVLCYLLLFCYICTTSKKSAGHRCVRLFLCLFFKEARHLYFVILPVSTTKTDMPVSEVSILKNGILCLVRGSHLRRVFPVPRNYLRQSNTVPITGSEVQPKWSNPSVCPHACGLVLHVWSSPFRQKPKEGFHYSKQRQSEDRFNLHPQHR